MKPFGGNKPISMQPDISVNRETIKNDVTEKANALLAEMGEQLAPVEGLKYMGSAAVHVYWNDTFGYAGFIVQADGLIKGKCNELVAQAAIADLTGSVMEKYGHKRPTKRNGF